MKISDILTSMAAWLENPNNEALLASDSDDECLAIVTAHCVEAADILKQAAIEAQKIEPANDEIKTLASNDILDTLKKVSFSIESQFNTIFDKIESNNNSDLNLDYMLLRCAHNLSNALEQYSNLNNTTVLNDEGIDTLASLADALDSSGDPELMKQAALIDELLITISAPEGAVASKKAADEKKLEELAKKFHVGDKILETNGLTDVAKDVEPVVKNYKNLEAPLSTRYCPDHPGVNLYKIEDNVWVCELDKKKYDYTTGFKLMDGSQVSGGDVSNQTEYHRNNDITQFDTRETRQNR